MKNTIKLFIAAATAVLIVMAAGCKADDVQSKEECLEDFFGKAQADSWTTMYEEIHPDNVNRNTYKNGYQFDLIYNNNVTYSISSKSGNTYYLFVNPEGGVGDTEKFVFRAEEGDGLFEGDTWLIYSFTDGGQSATY